MYKRNLHVTPSSDSWLLKCSSACALSLVLGACSVEGSSDASGTEETGNETGSADDSTGATPTPDTDSDDTGVDTDDSASGDTSDSGTNDDSDDEGNDEDSSMSSSTEDTGTPEPRCGDGNVDAGEECDDGNDVNTDACLDTCKSASCGDSFVWEENEICDDGNTDALDGCTADCLASPTEITTMGSVGTGLFGGGGGEFFDDDCSDNHLLVGFQGVKLTNGHTELAGRCKAIELAGDENGHPIIVTPADDEPSILPERGRFPAPDEGREAWTLDCPENQFVVGFNGSLEDGGLIEQLGFRCAPLQFVAGEEEYTVEVGDISDTEKAGEDASEVIPNTDCSDPDLVAVGQRGRRGWQIDQFGINCAEILIEQEFVGGDDDGDETGESGTDEGETGDETGSETGDAEG